MTDINIATRPAKSSKKRSKKVTKDLDIQLSKAIVAAATESSKASPKIKVPQGISSEGNVHAMRAWGTFLEGQLNDVHMTRTAARASQKGTVKPISVTW